MEDIGSLLFYIVLGIIALVGSFQGKGKKKPGAPKPSQGRTGTITSKPPVRTTSWTPGPAPSPARQERPAPRPSPWSVPSDPSMEGRYEEPMARDFSREGTISEPMAGEFSREGSTIFGESGTYASEGSIAETMAAAYASEGVSALSEPVMGEFIHTEISDSEIGDIPAYDYNARPGAVINEDGFDLKKAVIYSVLLDRKEYSY